MKRPVETQPENENPGVPGFSTWKGIYILVFAWFVVVVIFLTIFSRVYA
jgi:hypothetical protein